MLAKELRREGFRSKQGTLIDKGYRFDTLDFFYALASRARIAEVA